MKQRGVSTEQRVCIKSCFKLGKSARETVQVLVQTFGKEAVNNRAVFRWHKRFRDGRESIEDGPRTGRPSKRKSPKNIELVRQKLAEDPSLSVRTMARELGMSKNVVHTIIRDLMKRAVAGEMDQPENIDENSEIQENIVPECTYEDSNSSPDPN